MHSEDDLLKFKESIRMGKERWLKGRQMWWTWLLVSDRLLVSKGVQKIEKRKKKSTDQPLCGGKCHVDFLRVRGQTPTKGSSKSNNHRLLPRSVAHITIPEHTQRVRPWNSAYTLCRYFYQVPRTSNVYLRKRPQSVSWSCWVWSNQSRAEQRRKRTSPSPAVEIIKW